MPFLIGDRLQAGKPPATFVFGDDPRTPNFLPGSEGARRFDTLEQAMAFLNEMAQTHFNALDNYGVFELTATGMLKLAWPN